MKFFEELGDEITTKSKEITSIMDRARVLGEEVVKKALKDPSGLVELDKMVCNLTDVEVNDPYAEPTSTD